MVILLHKMTIISLMTSHLMQVQGLRWKLKVRAARNAVFQSEPHMSHDLQIIPTMQQSAIMTWLVFAGRRFSRLLIDGRPGAV